MTRGHTVSRTVWATSCAILLAACITEIVLRHRARTIARSDIQDPGMIVYHAELGWKLQPGRVSRHRHHDFDVEYTVGPGGFRSDPAHGVTGKQEVTAIMGDSFTFGFGVEDTETFCHWLNVVSTNEVILNLGVPGYSTDQEYLLLRRTVLPINPDRILLVLYLGNDVLDNGYPYPLQAGRGKPYFALDSGNIELKNVPVPRNPKPEGQYVWHLENEITGASGTSVSRFRQLLRRLQIASPFWEGAYDEAALAAAFETKLSDRLALTKAILKAADDACEKHDIDFSVAILPGRSFTHAPKGLSARFQDYLRHELLAFGQDNGVPVHDLATGLRDAHNQGNTLLFFPNDGHLTPTGHKTVADILLNRLAHVSVAQAAPNPISPLANTESEP